MPLPADLPPFVPRNDQTDRGSTSPTDVNPTIKGYHPPPPNGDWSGLPEKHIGGHMKPSRDHKMPSERNHFGGPSCKCPQCRDRHPITGRFHEDY